jgi:hypothetical protein
MADGKVIESFNLLTFADIACWELRNFQICSDKMSLRTKTLKICQNHTINLMFGVHAFLVNFQKQ